MIQAARSLFPAEAWGVDVKVGLVPASLEGATHVDLDVQASDDAILVNMRSQGRVLVTANCITLDVADDVQPEQIDFYLYGLVPRALRILREEYSLHASCVVRPAGGAVAIMGRPMAGKSTTVMGLVKRNYGLIIDDILPVDIVGGVPQVFGWDRPVHLRPRTAQHFGYQQGADSGSTRIKATVPGQFEPMPLAALFELVADTDDREVCVRKLDGVERLASVVAHSDLSSLSSVAKRARSYFAWVTAVANAVPVYRITRPTDGWTVDEILDLVVKLSDDAGNQSD